MTDRSKGLKALIGLLRRYPWAIAGIVGLGLLASLAEGIGISLFIPLLQWLGETGYDPGRAHWLVDSLRQLFRQVPAERRLLAIAAGIFGSILLKAVLSYSHGVVFSWLKARISHQLRSGVFKQLLSVSYGFLEKQKSGELLNTLSTETWRVSDALSVLVGAIITTGTVAVYLALLLLISWEMTLLVLAAMLVIAAIVRLLTRRVKRLGQHATRANAQLTHRMLEGMAGMRAIRAFSRESYEQGRFEDISARVSDVFMKLGIVSGLVRPVYEVLSGVLLVTILFVSLQDLGRLPAFLVFIFVLYRLQPKVRSLDDARTGLNALAAGVEDVMSLLDRSDKPYLSSGSISHQQLSTAIVFEHVTFCYDAGEEPALRDVSLRLPVGKATALVGPSGAGKSTLIKLLFRFYEVDGGEIYIDGHPLRALDLTSWHTKMALVSEDAYIFNADIWSNIAYGRLDASEEEIIAAARKADAHAFISQLPRGYATEVGDRGVRLSAGQRQRLALARAIVRDPELLILDEATNAVDSISENLIQEALDLSGQDRTVIIIAHRLSSVEHADHIVVLEEGRVREQGPFRHLLEQGGLFRRLYDLQHRSGVVAVDPQ